MRKLLLLSLILLIVLAACGIDEVSNEQSEDTTVENQDNQVEEENSIDESEENEEIEEEPEEIEFTAQEEMLLNIVSLIEEGIAFDAGSYVKGDIPKGEYAFVTFEGSGEYYSEEDASGDIIDNENFDSFGYVHVHEAGNLTTRGVLVHVDDLEMLGVSGAKELYEILNDVENYNESGWYKVGVDIDPGKYIIESYGSGYVAVMSGPVGKSDIIDNNLFDGRYSVNVQDGQYLVISRGYISE